MRFFLISQGSLKRKIKFLGLKVCSVAWLRTDGRTHRQTHTKVTTEGTLSGFQEFFLQPIIRDRPNKWYYIYNLSLNIIFKLFFHYIIFE